MMEKYSHLFEIVEEPEYSQQQILSIQQSNKTPFSVFHDVYKNNIKHCKIKDNLISEWAYNFEIFIEAGGDMKSLQ